MILSPDITLLLYKSLWRKKELNIEQVGYIKPAIMGGELRLEMIGGEFCGNASRSFELYVAKSKGLLEHGNVNIKISSCSAVLNAETDVIGEKASVSMPLPWR